ncbi:MAG: hypothetical protein ACM359_17815, partial [Bacillota bacterium]
PSGQADTQGIQGTLASAANAAIRSTDQLPNFFTSSDRQRLSDFSQQQQQHPQLATALGNLRALWQQKYHQDFDLSGKSQVVFGEPQSNLTIVQLQVTSPTLLSNQPVQSSGQQGPQYQPSPQYQPRSQQSEKNPPIQQSGRGHTSWGQQLQSSADQSGPVRGGVGGPGEPPANVIPSRPQPSPGQQAAQGQQPQQGYQAVQAGQPQGPSGITTPTSGLDVAIVTFPSGYGLPSTNVALINESSAATAGAIQAGGMVPPTPWRIDVPDNVSSSDLVTRLTNHIEGLNAGQNSWPNDVNEAYRLVTHHVMQAIYETSAQLGQTGS